MLSVAKGLSTYDYIVQQRDEDEKRSDQHMCLSLHKVSQILPHNTY